MKTHAYNIAIAMFAISATIFGCKKESIMPLDAQKINEVPIKDDKKVPKDGKILPNPNFQPVPDSKDYISNIHTYLLNGKWKIQAYFDDGDYTIDLAKPFEQYTFAFNDYNVVLSEKNGKGFPGKWNLYLEKGIPAVAFDFGVQPLISINDVWTPLAYNSKLVRLEKMGKKGMMHLDFVQVSEEPLIIK